MGHSDMSRESLVSIVIPTRNEEAALPITLNSVNSQTYRNIELIIVDSNSTDKTKKIASDFGAKVINYDGKLLGARYLGVKESTGEYVLFLDADLVLENSTLDRAVELMKDYDMLILEESSYNPSTWLQKQICKERLITEGEAIASGIIGIDSGLYPRFFRRELLIKGFQNIPEKLFQIVFAHEDKIIRYEMYKISKSVGILPKSVMHIDERTLIDLVIHSYRNGKSARDLAKTGLYTNICAKPIQISKLKRAIVMKTTLITLMRVLAYRIGYHL
jgi:glycosyltransferase involved in cell wall biosynthesis